MATLQQLKDELQKEDILVLGAIEVIQTSKKDKGGKGHKPIRLVVALKGNALKLMAIKLKSSSVKHQWDLAKFQTITINGKPGSDENEFSVQLDSKVYRYQAPTQKEKLFFIELLVKMAKTHTGIPIGLDNLKSLRTGASNLSVGTDIVRTEDTYEEMSAKEAADIESIVGNNTQAIRDGEAYSNALKKELGTLEKANVVMILQSDKVTDEVQNMLDAVLNDLEMVEEFIRLYQEQLTGMRADVAKLAKRDKLLAIQSTNYNKLSVDLKNLLEVLDPDEINQKYRILDEGESDLDNEEDRRLCLIAAKKLSDAYHLSQQSGLADLEAVSYTLRIVKDKETGFVNRLERKLKSIIDSHVAHAGLKGQDTTLPSHKENHRQLLPFADLVDWLRTSQFKTFQWLMMYYPEAMGRAYKKELDELVERTVASLGIHQKNLRDSRGAFDLENLTSYVQNDMQAQTMANKITKTLGQFFLDATWYFADERKFCAAFFHEDSRSHQAGEDAEDGVVDRNKFSRHHLRAMLDTIFLPLPGTVGPMVTLTCRLDRFNCVSLATLLERAVSANTEDAKTTLTTTLVSTQIDLKRRFDTLIQEQIREIEEVKLGGTRFKIKNKKDTVDNITTTAASFPPFVKKIEEKLEGQQRSAVVDRAICTLAQKVFGGIERLAAESKNQDLVLFENYHYLYSELSMMKLPHLEPYRKEAQSKYRQHIALYVKENLGHPMEKLSKFMQGVQHLIDSGVKDSEICFQLQYSKQNLKKLVDAYPAKEVKKGLQSVYRKVEKEISTDSGQLQVVWRFMQDDFLSQYQHYDDIIRRCYPNSGIKLDFELQDLLNYFSEIAQSH
eukprot:comp21660_c0_seq1/m.30462 comp21660_c0_seq1/g.30462  ORF comp21660_c0_seq1/g.30462 comp21660_c0_seq1/m.30462 type:complete len:839 (-) comp21660_c0_seq1:120-2636(-)